MPPTGMTGGRLARARSNSQAMLTERGTLKGLNSSRVWGTKASDVPYSKQEPSADTKLSIATEMQSVETFWELHIPYNSTAEKADQFTLADGTSVFEIFKIIDKGTPVIYRVAFIRTANQLGG